MIHDLTLRWVVTILFGLSAAECLGALVAGDRRWVGTVSNVLHVVMAVAMAVMAWPKGAELPTTAPMAFFFLAAVWFAVIAVHSVGAGHRLANVYHGLMMLAMAWMYAVMNGEVLPGQSDDLHTAAPVGHGHGMDMPGMDMPGMDMPGMDMAGMGESTGGSPAWITMINWLCTVGFAVAAVWWLSRYFTSRRTAADDVAQGRLGVLCMSMMAAGMAIMFGVML